MLLLAIMNGASMEEALPMHTQSPSIVSPLLSVEEKGYKYQLTICVSCDLQLIRH